MKNMFTVLCRIENIDYSSCLTLLSPIFTKYNIPIGVGEAALRLMPNIAKQRILISIVRLNKGRILGIIQSLAARNNIKVQLQDMMINGVGDMLEIGIKVEALDYGSVAEAVLPMLVKILNDNSKLCFLNELLEDPQAVRNIISAILDNIPDETKSNMVSSVVECYQEEILNVLNGVIHNKGIVADILEIDVKSE